MNALSSISNPVFEAMICGKPVIALNVGTTSDMIQDNINGILVNPNQIEVLPQIVIYLLNNSGKMESIGKKYQKLINEEWPTWEERINYEIELVRKLVLNSD